MLTEDQIERRVEKMVNHLDRIFMAGLMTEGEYDKQMKAVDQWAEKNRRPWWHPS